MKRPWALWVVSRRSLSLSMLDPGFSYTTEAAARRGLERLVRTGELRRREDGKVVTAGLGYEVVVQRKL